MSDSRHSGLNSPRFHQWVQTLAILGGIVTIAFKVGGKNEQLAQLGVAVKDLSTVTTRLVEGQLISQTEIRSIESRLVKLEDWTKGRHQ